MDAIEVKVDNVNLIEVEFEPGQTDIEIAANFNPVIEVKEFDYPQELVLVNQRIAQILQANGKLVEWNKSATHIQYRYAGDTEWIDYIPLEDIKGEKGDPQTREGLGLGTLNSPEFANTQITNLQSNAVTGGVIPVAEATWLGATAKSVISYIAAIVHYLYGVKDAITFATPRLNETLTGAILLDRTITQYNNLSLTGALVLSVGASPLVEGTAEGVIIGNGTDTPTLSGITLWATSASFDPTNLKQNHFMVWKQGDGVYIAWTQKN